MESLETSSETCSRLNAECWREESHWRRGPYGPTILSCYPAALVAAGRRPGGPGGPLSCNLYSQNHQTLLSESVTFHNFFIQLSRMSHLLSHCFPTFPAFPCKSWLRPWYEFFVVPGVGNLMISPNCVPAWCCKALKPPGPEPAPKNNKAPKPVKPPTLEMQFTEDEISAIMEDGAAVTCAMKTPYIVPNAAAFAKAPVEGSDGTTDAAFPIKAGQYHPLTRMMAKEEIPTPTEKRGLLCCSQCSLAVHLLSLEI